MLIEGLKLLTIGMGIVFLFLILMHLSIYILGLFLEARSIAEYNEEISGKEREFQLIPIIAAAISVYRQDKTKKK
jgi:sodium pump decarboxylase gamma subunit